MRGSRESSEVIVIPETFEAFARRSVDEFRDLRLLDLRPVGNGARDGPQ